MNVLVEDADGTYVPADEVASQLNSISDEDSTLLAAAGFNITVSTVHSASL